MSRRVFFININEKVNSAMIIVVINSIGETFDIKIDKKNYHLLSRYRWHINNGYAETNLSGRNIRMHRLIIGAKKDEIVHHKNKNRLDNRERNLIKLKTHQVHKSYHRKENERVSKQREKIKHIIPEPFNAQNIPDNIKESSTQIYFEYKSTKDIIDTIDTYINKKSEV